MRVVAGKYRHRLLIYPDDALHIRPTKDRIREAIFSSLAPIQGLKVLDLYAGSGAMAIEALSREAKEAYLVDNNKIAISTINKNISNLAINNAKVLFLNDFDALEKFKNDGIVFDLIFLDPPYKEGKYIEVIKYIIDNHLITKEGRIITECDYDLDFSSFEFTRIKTHQYGEIKVNVLHL